MHSTGVISEPDVQDSTTIDENLPPADLKTGINIRDISVGIPKEYHHENLSSEILDVWQQVVNLFRQSGASVKEVRERTEFF